MSNMIWEKTARSICPCSFPQDALSLFIFPPLLARRANVGFKNYTIMGLNGRVQKATNKHEDFLFLDVCMLVVQRSDIY